jgi:hypothetical protein
MTGWRMGRCNPYARAARRNWWGGFGFGRGLGRGWAKGFRWRWCLPFPCYQGIAPEEEVSVLRKEADFLKQELEAINKRLAELERESS